MDKSLLVKLLGFQATLLHGDCLVRDRWSWICQRLPLTKASEEVLDVGCGTGAFTIGAVKRGYKALGLSWDERNQTIAAERAKICRADDASFEVCDVRRLHEFPEYVNRFDVVLCMENIEHIAEDARLVKSMAATLKPGGRLLLSTPNLLFRSMGGDNGPVSEIEDGGHVRRGYNKSMLRELCEEAGLQVEELDYCSGFVSQKVTRLQRALHRINHWFAWGATFPLRILPPLLDKPITRWMGYPGYSICLHACKPRFAGQPES